MGFPRRLSRKAHPIIYDR